MEHDSLLLVKAGQHCLLQCSDLCTAFLQSEQSILVYQLSNIAYWKIVIFIWICPLAGTAWHYLPSRKLKCFSRWHQATLELVGLCLWFVSLGITSWQWACASTWYTRLNSFQSLFNSMAGGSLFNSVAQLLLEFYFLFVTCLVLFSLLPLFLLNIATAAAGIP